MRLRRTFIALAAVLAVVAAGCGSSSSKATGSATGSATGPTYTIGLLTDLTGVGASGTHSSVQGVQAGIQVAKQEGYNVKLDVADTTSSPTGALAAAQKLVDEDHVFAVIAESVFTFAGAKFLTAHGVPVLGWPNDGSEWNTSVNMFSVQAYQDPTLVPSTHGKFMKLEGVTNVASVGYGIVRSAEAAKSYALSSEAAGLKVGYLNANLPLGTTDVQPIALQMKSAGVDGFIAPLSPSTGLLLIKALRQDNVTLKAALLGSGYGGDLIQGGANGVQNAQGVSFLLPWEPVEMHSAATRKLQEALANVGVNGDPTYAQYAGYIAVDLLVQGLKAAGSKPTQASFINAVGHIQNYNAVGLLGNLHINYSNRSPDGVAVQNCVFVTKLEGSSFHLVPGADPVCGSIVPGKRVSAS
jgi:branched-chain amino acid transport system substrate-binding protein